MNRSAQSILYLVNRLLCWQLHALASFPLQASSMGRLCSIPANGPHGRKFLPHATRTIVSIASFYRDIAGKLCRCRLRTSCISCRFLKDGRCLGSTLRVLPPVQPSHRPTVTSESRVQNYLITALLRAACRDMMLDVPLRCNGMLMHRRMSLILPKICHVAPLLIGMACTCGARTLALLPT